jgi:hypothetical protein
MSTFISSEIIEGLYTGEVVPYLGPGVLADVKYTADGRPLLGEGESLILAMNGGRPMNGRLMTEFARAAMSLELSKGRKFLTNFLEKTYGGPAYAGGAVHEWLASLALPYVIDTNRDVRLQDLWAGRPHTLVVGIARLSASWNRYRIWENDGAAYREIAPEAVNKQLPVLFKPLGTPRPTPTFVASDADYVDYITELMGGFAIPGFLKEYRPGKRYLVVGLRLTRDTQRMILSDMIVDAGSPAGWALIPEPTAKERRYCASKNLEIIECSIPELLGAAAGAQGMLARSARSEGEHSLAGAVG